MPGSGSPPRIRAVTRPCESAAENGLEFAQLRLEPGADPLADFVNARVGDPVEGAGALFAAGDEALGQQRAEVLGDVLLGGAEDIGQLADRGLLAAAQVVDDPQPGGIGESAEAAGDQLGGV